MSTRSIAERLRGRAALNGRVLAVRGAVLQVATPQGLAELPASSGVLVGDTVRLSEGRVTRASTREGAVYFL